MVLFWVLLLGMLMGVCLISLYQALLQRASKTPPVTNSDPSSAPTSEPLPAASSNPPPAPNSDSSGPHSARSATPPPASSSVSSLLQNLITDSGPQRLLQAGHRVSLALFLDLSLSVTDSIRAKMERKRQLCDIAADHRLGKQGCLHDRLPAELYITVAERLQGADFLSYAYCSKATAFLNHNQQPLRSTKSDFAARLRRDRDRRILKLKGLDDGAYHWCGSHRLFHHTALFAPQQLKAKMSEDARVCMATKGRFRVCEHRSFSALELQYRTPLVPTEKVLLCDQHGDSEAGIQGPIFSVADDYSTTVFTAQHVLVESPFFAPITNEQVQTSLTQLSIHICPHVTTSAEPVRKRLLELRRRQKIACSAGIFADVKGACEVLSACEICGASFALSRLEGGGHLLLKVRREIHKVRDLVLQLRDNVDVLANLEDCGQVCCGFMGTDRCYPGYHERLRDAEGSLRRL